MSGCSLLKPIAFVPPEASLELSDTPFFAQSEYHCGPAALAMMLTADGAATSPAALTALIYLPGRRGSLQAEILAATRQFERMPLRLGPEPEQLIKALQSGSPVLVLQNLGIESLPVWHYAVLIGYDADSNVFVLHSGTRERMHVRAQIFLKSWNLAGRWALVMAHADHVAPVATLERWIAAAAPFESTGNIAFAMRAYESASKRWPEAPLVWQAKANAFYAQGNLASAEAALRRAVDLGPQSVSARNNLANVLLERGCPAAAMEQLAELDEVPESLRDTIEQTRADINNARNLGTKVCQSPQ